MHTGVLFFCKRNPPSFFIYISQDNFLIFEPKLCIKPSQKWAKTKDANKQKRKRKENCLYLPCCRHPFLTLFWACKLDKYERNPTCRGQKRYITHNQGDNHLPLHTQPQNLLKPVGAHVGRNSEAANADPDRPDGLGKRIAAQAPARLLASKPLWLPWDLKSRVGAFEMAALKHLSTNLPGISFRSGTYPDISLPSRAASLPRQGGGGGGG